MGSPAGGSTFATVAPMSRRRAHAAGPGGVSAVVTTRNPSRSIISADYASRRAAAFHSRDRARLAQLQPGRDALARRQRARRLGLLHAPRANAGAGGEPRGTRSAASRAPRQHALPLGSH